MDPDATRPLEPPRSRAHVLGPNPRRERSLCARSQFISRETERLQRRHPARHAYPGFLAHTEQSPRNIPAAAREKREEGSERAGTSRQPGRLTFLLLDRGAD